MAVAIWLSFLRRHSEQMMEEKTRKGIAASFPYLILYVTFSLEAQTVWAINMIVPVILHARRNKVFAHIWTLFYSLWYRLLLDIRAALLPRELPSVQLTPCQGKKGETESANLSDGSFISFSFFFSPGLIVDSAAQHTTDYISLISLS